jgi:ubiquinone/menaquinone biosynthesis C-methylase UbiE
MEKDAFKFSGSLAANSEQYLGAVMFEPSAIELVSRIKSPETINSILEIACGTGRVTRQLRERFNPPVKLVATDISADMLSVAQSTLNDPSIEFGIADAQALSFADNSFDLVVFQYGLMFLPDKKKGLSEALRVLKPGGRFIATTWDKTENTPLLNLLFNQIILPNFQPEDNKRLLTPFSLHDPVILTEWMQETGFKHTEVNKVTFKSGAVSPEHVANGYFRKHAIGQEVLAADPGKFEAMAQKIQKSVSLQFGSEVVSDFSAVFMTGEK